MKSVIATENMPPRTVYTSTVAAPMIMPICCVTAPSETTKNTSPSALICAPTQPRYEITMQSVVNISTGRL
jgi:hypothetical protein